MIQTIEILLRNRNISQGSNAGWPSPYWKVTLAGQGTCTSTSRALIYPQTQLGVIHCYPEVAFLLMFFHYHPKKKMWNYMKIPTYMTKPPFIRDVLFALIARRYSICWTEWCHFLRHSSRSARLTRRWSSTSVRLMGHPSRAPSRVVSPLPKYSI